MWPVSRFWSLREADLDEQEQLGAIQSSRPGQQLLLNTRRRIHRGGTMALYPRSDYGLGANWAFLVPAFALLACVMAGFLGYHHRKVAKRDQEENEAGEETTAELQDVVIEGPKGDAGVEPVRAPAGLFEQNGSPHPSSHSPTRSKTTLQNVRTCNFRSAHTSPKSAF
jgi:hypothetical protein